MTLATGANADPDDQRRWDARYQGDQYIFGQEPIAVLKDEIGLLPKGRALDIAMGEGRNGVFLATQGFQVLGLDISENGLRKARRLARQRGTTIETQRVDLEQARLAENTYDVIVMAYYLQRDLFPQIKRALKPGGVVVVETYNQRHLRYKPDMPRAYLLETNELLDVFRDFVVLRYVLRDDGAKAYSTIVAKKPRGGPAGARGE